MSDPQSGPAALHHGGPSSDGPARLPWSALLALALTSFVIITTETLPAGLLNEISAGLSVGEGAAGQLVSVYAAGTVVSAIPSIALTRRLQRRPVLVAGVLGFVVANSVTAVSDVYTLTLAARLVAGAFSGLLWGLIPGYTRRIVPSAMAGRGLAIAMAGTPAALAIGTPLGTFAGGLIGWRTTFGALSVIAVVLLVWVRLAVPDAPGQNRAAHAPLARVLRLPGIAPVLVVVVAWMLAHNLLYTYISPYLASTGARYRVDVVLLVFGLAALVGIWGTAVLVDRALRPLVLLSLTAFAASALVLALFEGTPALLYLAVAVWGLTFGGSSTLLNTAAADAGGESNTDAVASIVCTVWNLAIFGGSALGAGLIALSGPPTFPWALLVLALASLAVSALARHHAFPPGPRTTSTSS